MAMFSLGFSFCSFVQVSYFPTPVVRAIIKKAFLLWNVLTDWLWDELNLRNNPKTSWNIPFCLLTLEEFVLLFVVSSLTEQPKTIRAVAALLKTVFPKADVWRLQYNFLLNNTGSICFTEWAAVRVEQVLITWCQDIWLQVQTPPVWACWGLWGGWIQPGQGVRPKGSLQVLTLHLPAETDRCTCGFEWSSTDRYEYSVEIIQLRHRSRWKHDSHAVQRQTICIRIPQSAQC